MSILGNRVLRREDPRLLTVGGTYVDDVRLEGAAYATYVRSTLAHGRITTLDVSAAKTAPGVLGVFTAADLDIGPFPPAIEFFPPEMALPWLAGDVVRYVGEPVAVLVT